MNPIAAIQQQINQAISAGVNATLEAVLRDLQANVPARSGRLLSGYAITQRAVPGNLNGEIRSPLPYSAYQYPYRLYKPSPRHPASYPVPSLFAPKRAGFGVLVPAETGKEAIEALATTKIEAELKKVTDG